MRQCLKIVHDYKGFNPLDRVKFVQIRYRAAYVAGKQRFNPLDRVKFVQISPCDSNIGRDSRVFQSPRSGQICSNEDYVAPEGENSEEGFNPLDRVKFVQMKSNQAPQGRETGVFQSPRSGQICSNSLKDYSRKIKTNKFI